jgi:hypothetical protein
MIFIRLHDAASQKDSHFRGVAAITQLIKNLNVLVASSVRHYVFYVATRSLMIGICFAGGKLTTLLCAN